MNVIKLNQDNNWNNRLNKKGIAIDKDVLEHELRNFFGWRTPTKKFKSFTDRFLRLGSTEHDKFINHLIDNKNY